MARKKNNMIKPQINQMEKYDTFSANLNFFLKILRKENLTSFKYAANLLNYGFMMGKLAKII